VTVVESVVYSFTVPGSLLGEQGGVHMVGKRMPKMVTLEGKKMEKMAKVPRVAVASFSCDDREQEKSISCMECQKLVKMVYESCVMETLRRENVAAPDGKSAKKFENGIAVLQWWSDWFKNIDLQRPLAHYQKKQRSAWFSGEVLSYAGWDRLQYACCEQEFGHLYHTYSWNGTHEVVPEAFLQIPPPEVSRRHTSGRCTQQGPYPAFCFRAQDRTYSESDRVVN